VLSVLISTLVYQSCKDENPAKEKLKQLTSDIIITQAQQGQVYEQMKWIARGAVKLATTDQAFQDLVHSTIESTEFYMETNGVLQTESMAQLQVDYFTNVLNDVNLFFPINNYNSGYFYEVVIDGCVNKVGVRIPEADIIDRTKTLVITAEDPFDDTYSSSTGYFYNDGGGVSSPFVDSLTITEDNMDSVYLWVVGFAENCKEVSSGGSEGTGVSFVCDDDGICEPEQGETIDNCADCQNLPSGNTLKLVSYTSKTDRKKFSNSHPEKRYQEAFFQGRYSLTYSTYIYYPTTNDSVVNDRGSIGGVEYLPLQTNFKAWGANAEIKRTKKTNGGSTKSNRGSHTTKTLNQDWSYTYNKNVDALFFTIFEEDEWHTPYIVSRVQDVNGTNVTAEYFINSNGKTYSHHSTPSGTSEIIYIPPASSDWVPDGNGGYTLTHTLDGEFEIVLSYTPRP
jgi:hypothetical protein